MIMILYAYLSEPSAYNDEYRHIGSVTYPIHVELSGPRTLAAPPIVRILTLPKTAAEMPPGEIQAPAEHASTLVAAGYSCAGMAGGDLKAYWDDARGRPVKAHWHPQARLVLY
jgi:hypothetical protein